MKKCNKNSKRRIIKTVEIKLIKKNKLVLNKSQNKTKLKVKHKMKRTDKKNEKLDFQIIFVNKSIMSKFQKSRITNIHN